MKRQTAAYLTSAHSAKSAKSHKGVITLFHKLARADTALGQSLAGDLTAGYHFKEMADYATGLAATVTQSDAGAAIATAENFVEVVRSVLNPPSSASTP